MSLEKCIDFGDYIFRRWLRLFPAMLIASILILITAPFFSARPFGTPYAEDLIPGLTFIEPELFRVVLHNHQKLIEGASWALFVEVKFYTVAGLLYFTFGQKKMIAVLIGMFLISTIFGLFQPHLPKGIKVVIGTILHYLNYQFYGWFAAGALFYRYFTLKDSWSFFIGLIIAFISARELDGFLSISMIFATVMVLIFSISMFNHKLQNLPSNKVLVSIGFISYPLYLIHENAMISMIVQLHHEDNWIPGIFLPIIQVLVIIFVAWLIARFLEPRVRGFIKVLLPKVKELRI